MKRRNIVIAMGVALAAVLASAGTSGAQSATEITLIHGIPGVTVDVQVGGSVVFSDVQVGDAEDLSASAGTQLVDVEIIDTSDDSVLLSVGSVDLPADGSHTLIVNLDASGSPVISMFDNDPQPVTTDGQGRLTVRHAAAAPAVNVVTGAATLVSNLAYGASQSVDVAAGAISDAELTLTNGDPVASLPAISVTANVNVIVYVIGSAADATVGVLTQDVGLPAPAVTTTTDPNATTTTTDPNATTTTTVVAVPVAVNTGSPLDAPVNTTLIAIAIGAFLVTGGAILARRRADS